MDAKSEHYSKVRLLGEGAFGKAFLVEGVNTGQLCVIKQVNMV
jgi:NIMA (never in mitosis gene a)-related kinase